MSHMDYVLLEWEMDREIRKLRREARQEMLKRIGKIALALLLFVFFFIMAWFWGEGNDIAHAEGVTKNPVVNVHGGDKEHNDEPEYAYSFSEEEEWMLLHIGHAEAGNQGVYGIALVMRVVVNRMEDGRWGNTMHDVLYYPNQFSTVGSGSWNREPNADCYEALEMIRQGWDESQGALFFRTTSGTFTWATYLFTHGNHAFYIA